MNFQDKLKNLGKGDFELEFKYSIPNASDFMQIYKTLLKLHGKPIFSYIVDIGTRDQLLRREYTSEPTIKTKEHKKLYLKKERIYYERLKVSDINYRIALSNEIPLLSVDLKGKELTLRTKIRASFMSGKWRFDLTLLNMINMPSTSVKTGLHKMFKRSFKGILANSLFTNSKYVETYSDYEFEMEYVETNFDTFIYDNDKLIDAEIKFLSIISPDIKKEDILFKNMIQNITKMLGIQKYDSSRGLKFITNQVHQLTINTFFKDIMKKINNFYVTDKADGDRSLVIINNGTYSVITNKIEKSNIPLQQISENKSNSSESKFMVNPKLITIIDAEYVEGYIHSFDVLMFNGKNLMYEPFGKRLQYLAPASSVIKNCTPKPFLKLDANNYQENVEKMYNRKAPYEIDGLIFYPDQFETVTKSFKRGNRRGGGYGKWNNKGHNNNRSFNKMPNFYNSMIVYKWKPSKFLSVDFLMKRVPKKMEKIEPYNSLIKKGFAVYILFSGIRKKMRYDLSIPYIAGYDIIFPGKRQEQYQPIHYSPSDNPSDYIYSTKNINYDGKIGEFRKVDGHFSKWDLMRIRHDRQKLADAGVLFGNDFRIADMIYWSYVSNFDLKKLTSEYSGYFKLDAVQKFKSVRKMGSIVKSKILDFARTQFKGCSGTSKIEWIIDMAAGKGQDLARWQSIGTDNAIFVDIDAAALEELNSRKFSFRGFRTYTVHANLEGKPKDVLKQFSHITLPNKGVSIISCNFAMHYFAKDKKSLTNICKLISCLLCKGGRFSMVAFDGLLVNKLLDNHNGNWKTDKYNIIRINTHEIKLSLPFTGDELIHEYLINFDELIACFKKAKMELKHIGTYNDFNEFNIIVTEDQDKQFASLYSYALFQKK